MGLIYARIRKSNKSRSSFNGYKTKLGISYEIDDTIIALIFISKYKVI